jgi:hypothetical protein
MSKTNDQNEPAGPTQEVIAQRAYELFLQRGSVPGYELDDWLQAEAELIAEAAREAGDDASDEEPTEPTEPKTGRSGGRRTGGRDRAAGRRSIRP